MLVKGEEITYFLYLYLYFCEIISKEFLFLFKVTSNSQDKFWIIYLIVNSLLILKKVLKNVEFPYLNGLLIQTRNFLFLTFTLPYLPTPPFGQDVTQGQFLSEVQQV